LRGRLSPKGDEAEKILRKKLLTINKKSYYYIVIHMKPSHIEHIGIAVVNLEAAISFYEKVLGLTCYNIEEVTDQKVRTAFFMIGQTKIELLESTDPEGPIGKFIEKRGEGIHHIAFSVEKIEEQLAHAANLGVRLIDSVPRKGAEGLNIAFLHPKSTSGVLIELCEKNQ
jgi:methylmalonyl-CoA/ethylmalonyl-CoA epimerase